MAYYWVKTLHLLFMIAFMAAVFYLPRILLNVVECAAQTEVRERLLLMGRRLYGFGHVMFGLTLVFGLVLWMHFKLSGGWLHAKLALVAVVFVYYIVIGRMARKAAAGGTLPSTRALRWINELPVLVLIPIIYLVVAKPF